MATLPKERSKQSDYEVNIAPRRGVDGAWNVEAIDDDGGIEQAIFAGPGAEQRARKYAEGQYSA